MKKLVLPLLIGLVAIFSQGTVLASADTNNAIGPLPLPDLSLLSATASIATPADSNGDVTCTGFAPPVVQHNLIVPSGVLCFVFTGSTVGHDILVEPNGGLATGGVTVGHDAKADHPSTFDIGDILVGGGRSVIGHNVTVDGSQGNVFLNVVCNAEIGHNLTIDNTTARFGWSVGDTDFFCAAGNAVDHNGSFQNNTTLLDISDNNPARAGGFGHDLIVENNTGLTIVEANFIGHNCRQEDNHPYTNSDGDGGPNVAGKDVNNCNTPNA